MKITVLKKYWIYWLFFVVVLLVGCSRFVIFEDRCADVEEIPGKVEEMEIYVMDEVKTGKYEPEAGIFTGAYVQTDSHISADISKYEELLGQKQTFKVFDYKADEGISKYEILKCMAQKKIPYIKLLLGTDYDLTPLYQMIFDIKAAYQIPIFIELYPITQKAYEPSSYRETYQRAYEIIHKYIKDVTIVWSSDDTRVEDAMIYYPGDRYTDWTGINIYIPRYKSNEPYIYLDNQKLDYWYKLFQGKKPMMISGLAISHFSRIDHAYQIQDTIEKLTLFYQDILQDYPRIKGIIYMDVDMAEVSSKGKEDYTLTGNNQIIEAMKELSIPLTIQTKLIPSKYSEYCYQKYSVSALYIEDELYIPEQYMSVCFSKVPLNKVKRIQNLSGDIFYNYREIQQYCTTFFKEKK